MESKEEKDGSFTLFPTPLRNDLNRLVEFEPFLNRNGEPCSTIISISFFSSELEINRKETSAEEKRKNSHTNIKKHYQRNMVTAETPAHDLNKSGRSLAK